MRAGEHAYLYITVPVSLLEWPTQRANYRYKDHLYGQLTNCTWSWRYYVKEKSESNEWFFWNCSKSLKKMFLLNALLWTTTKYLKAIVQSWQQNVQKSVKSYFDPSAGNSRNCWSRNNMQSIVNFDVFLPPWEFLRKIFCHRFFLSQTILQRQQTRRLSSHSLWRAAQ